MRILGNLNRTAGIFARDRKGNFAIIFGVASSVLALAVGFAVDTAQLMNAKSALRNAVDAAVTSTARSITLGDITEADAPKMVKAFLTANSTGGILTYDQIVLDRLTIDRTAKTVEAAAHVDVPLYFPLFGMPNSRRVTNVGAAVYSDKQIEVAMMLDITGSMRKSGNKDKIGDLQTAARNAVEALLRGNVAGAEPRVRVAIVPYAEGVNAGGLAANTVFYEKPGGPDLPPANSGATLVSLTSSQDNCATERKMKDGRADFSDDAPDSIRIVRRNGKDEEYFAKVNRDDRLEICPLANLVPLTADKDLLLATIRDFEADGVTAGGIAAQWGYYMLSPKWAPTIKSAGLGVGPANFDSKKVSKVAILMTDGAFNTAFAGVPVSDDRNNQPQNDQSTKSRSYAESVCANMKKAGISVFTIGFALPTSESSQARAVLKDCATDDTSSLKHFYDVSTGPELDAAFKEIIANTERLALTK
ncbi:TadE/TadG family type IV pilus assembly protein [Mesorhizobium sp. A623]